MTVLMHSSMKTVTLVDGDNVLGNPVTFTCASATGCVLVIDSTVKKAKDNGGGLTCGYVDDSVPPPGCGPDAAYYGYETSGFVHEQAKVGPGPHTAKLVVNDGAGAEVTGWTAQYTIMIGRCTGQTKTPPPIRTLRTNTGSTAVEKIAT